MNQRQIFTFILVNTTMYHVLRPFLFILCVIVKKEEFSGKKLDKCYCFYRKFDFNTKTPKTINEKNAPPTIQIAVVKQHWLYNVDEMLLFLFQFQLLLLAQKRPSLQKEIGKVKKLCCADFILFASLWQHWCSFSKWII